MDQGDIRFEIEENFEEIILFLNNIKNLVKDAGGMAEELFHYDDLYLPAITFEEFWKRTKDCDFQNNIYKYLTAVTLFLIQELYKGTTSNANKIYDKFVCVYNVLLEFSKSTVLNNEDFQMIVTHFIKEVLKIIGFGRADTYEEKVIIFQLATRVVSKLGALKGFGSVVLYEIHVKLSTMLGYLEEDQEFELDGIHVSILLYYLTVVKEVLKSSNENQDEFEGIKIFDALKCDFSKVEKVIKPRAPAFVLSLIYEICNFF